MPLFEPFKTAIVPELVNPFPDLDILHVDFESAYGKGYTLSGLTYPEYILGDRWKEFGCGVSWNNDEQIDWLKPHQLAELLAEIDPEEVCLAGQNLMFDASILNWRYGVLFAKYIDLRNLSRMVFPGEKADLLSITQRIWPNNPKMWKGNELVRFINKWELTPEEDEIMGLYCKNDVRTTRNSINALLPFVPESELRIMEATLRLYLEPPFILDKERTRSSIDAEIAENKAIIKASGMPKTALSSNKQFAERLRAIGVDVPTKLNPKGMVTDALGQSDPPFIRTMADHPELDHIWKARKAAKSTGNIARGERFLTMAELLGGRIAVPLNYAGAHTLRWSGAEKINVQSMKRGGELRKSLCAPPGYKVYVIDSSNIEARVVAWLAGHDIKVEKFRNGEDLYSQMATKIYGYDVFRKQKDADGNLIFFEEGNVGKTAELGLSYGMGAPKFRNTLASGPMGSPPIYKTRQFCETAVNIWRSDNVPILEYWSKMQEAIMNMINPRCDYHLGPLHITHQRITFPNGAWLSYPNIGPQSRENSDGTVSNFLGCVRREKQVKLYGGILTENVTQRAARDIVATQAMNMMDEFQDAQLGLLVHDEVVLIMPDDHCQERFDVMLKHIRQPLDWCPDLPLNGEGGWDDNYSK